MQVNEILDDAHKHPLTIGRDETIGQAMTILDKERIGALVVTGEKGEMAGILTERDILRLTYKHRGDIRNLLVKDHMSQNLIIGLPDDDLEYIAHLITQNRIRHIPVVDPQGKLCGIVSIGDIVKARLDEAEVEVRYLKEYITGRSHIGRK